MKWRWRVGVERSANPNILRECWTFLIRIFLHQFRKQLSRILSFQTRRNLQTFDWCFQFKQSYPWAFAILLLNAKTSREIIAIGIHLLRSCISEKFSIIDPQLLYAKTSREIIAIGIHLLRSCVSEKFSIIDPLWRRRKPLQFLIPLTLLPKNHNLFANIKKDESEGGKKGKSVSTSS